MRLSRALVFFSVSFLLTASCSQSLLEKDYFNKESNDLIDPAQGLSRSDYRNMHEPQDVGGKQQDLIDPGFIPPIPDMAPNVELQEEISLKARNIIEPPIPDVAQIIAAPKPPKIGAAKLVSVAVTDDVPLKDVLVELARLADIDIEVDSTIRGGISFRAKDRPFNEVIERIANLAGLRYSMRNNVLRVERDTPFIQVYPLDFINVDRTSSSNISINSTGGGGGSSGGSSGGGASSGGGGPSNSSSAEISIASKNDFWDQFDAAIKSIVEFQAAPMLSSTTIQPQPVVPLPPAADGTPQAPTPAPAVAQASDVPSSAGTGFYILNRQAGTLTVSATEKQHDIIKSYLKAMEKNVSSQVLIEAKIVEVSLNERYQSGIEWGRFGTQNLAYSGTFNTVGAAATGSSPATINVLQNKIFGTGVDLNLAVNLLSEFGGTRALSSPRLHAMNNQQAVLTFAENVVYFNVELEVTAAVAGTGGSPGTPAEIEVTSEQNTVPVGLLLSLQPTINHETSEITLSVRPTLTKVVKFVPDPAFPIIVASALGQLEGSVPQAVLDKIATTTNEVPQIETRELDSVLKIKSGQVMVIGGLLQDQYESNDTGVPGVAEVPWVGNLFKSVDKQKVKKELVIFIRASIIGSEGSADNADRNVYQKFINDPRPLEF